MVKDIKKQLQKIRPKLRLVAPLTYSLCWGFALLNLVFGLAMILVQRGELRPPLDIVAVLSWTIWGMIFLSIGLVMMYALLRNNWGLIKNIQLLGLGVKTTWLIALIIRSFESPASILITAVWLFLTHTQAMTYIHFMPQMGLWGGNTKKDA